MGLSATTHPLSALSPVTFTYKFNKEEKLSKSLTTFNGGFGYYKHEAFKDFCDAVLSKKNCLILTNNKPLKDVFRTDSRQIDIGAVAGCLFLKTSSEKYVTVVSDAIYVGGIGDRLFLNIIPISDNIVELKVSKTKHIQVEENYPYTAKLSEEILDGADIERQRFEIDYKDGLVSFKTKTKEGYRYLSYGMDQVVRATGLMLNETVVNPYLFVCEFVSENGLYYDFDAKASEVKYYNELNAYADRYNVNIKSEQESDTNLLISCTTADIASASSSEEVPINIALMKTNFSSSGSYLTKHTK